MNEAETSRRRFLAQTAHGLSAAALADLVAAGRADAAANRTPTNDPAAGLGLAWTGRLPWGRVLDITTVPGRDWHERLEEAQSKLAAQGGGVVFFPAGVYDFRDSIAIKDGVVLRGADPNRARTALDEDYLPPARFEFPRYRPLLSGDGMPIDTAFKGIYLEDPAWASNCGVVNLFVNRGHVHLDEAEGHEVGSNRLVFGCVLQNAAVADLDVPDLSIGQHAWQRYTRWHFAAIDVKAHENTLVANNRLIRSTDSFTMPGYLVLGRGKNAGNNAFDVVFDYDNRPGIEANHFCSGAPGGEAPSGTPESHPWAFRKGIVIRQNYIFSTGRTAIAFNGDGTICAGNVVRFPPDVWRPTNTGRHTSSGSSTNDNRAVEMRGYRWRVEDNDYEVYRNWAADHKYYINDGEGLMHENHCNSALIGSTLMQNRGNAYLSLYKIGLIDGLAVERNDVRVPEKIKDGLNQAVAIYVEADRDIRNNNRGPCRNVTIAGNTTAGGILLGGEPSSGNVIRGNRNLGATAAIKLRAEARLDGNEGYETTA